MKIGIVSQYVFPDDHEIRITKFIHTLTIQGHTIFVLSKSDRHHSAFDRIGNTEIHRLKPFNSNTWLNALLTLHLAFNPIWPLWIAYKCKQLGIELLIVRNLRLALPTILAAKWLSLKSIVDLGENHPGLARIQGKQLIRHYITRSPSLEALIEKITIRLADHIWVVVEQNKHRLCIAGGVHEDKFTVINNVPLLKNIWNVGVNDHEARTVLHDRMLRSVYIGSVDNIRGLELIIESLSIVKERCSDVELIIIGDGPERLEIEQLARRLEVTEMVEFKGWISSDSKYKIMQNCDVGLIPHKICELTQTTIPNKLFDYMAVGLPVLSTDLVPIRTVLEKNNCGLIMPEDARGIADLIIQLRDSPSRLRQMGLNGRKGVANIYNWEIEGEKVLKTVHSLLTD